MAVISYDASTLTWRLAETDTLRSAWYRLYGSSDWTNDRITVAVRPGYLPGYVGLIDLELGPYDQLILAENGVWHLNLQNVEMVRASSGTTEVELEQVGSGSFSTDGSLRSITMDVGHQTVNYVSASLDSTLYMGAGYDQVAFIDTEDADTAAQVAQQYWAFIRRDRGQVDAYSLYTGNRVRMQDELGNNYGKIEKFWTSDYRNGGNDEYTPFNDAVLGGANARGSYTNIDLKTYGSGAWPQNSDSYNLASFNHIRWTSDNLYVGEATVQQGASYMTPGAITSRGVLGTHDLSVSEQATAINGNFRLYVRSVEDGLYNQFNKVYLGTSSGESVSKAVVMGTDARDSVALYGFGGNDTLTGGSANDYLFGGSVDGGGYNVLTGGPGSDYFGVGNKAADGTVYGIGQDRIMDWDRGTDAVEKDTLRVLTNGRALIDGLYGVSGLGGNDLIDLRSKAAVAVSDEDGDSLSLVGSVSNEEDDLSVINQGIIIEHGEGGNDTIYGSHGVDYLYGGSGTNTLVGGTGADRFYIDSLPGLSYVTDFSTALGDKVYLDAQKAGGHTGKATAGATSSWYPGQSRVSGDWIFEGLYNSAVANVLGSGYATTLSVLAATGADPLEQAWGRAVVSSLGLESDADLAMKLATGTLSANSDYTVIKGHSHVDATFNVNEAENVYVGALGLTILDVSALYDVSSGGGFVDYFSQLGDGNNAVYFTEQNSSNSAARIEAYLSGTAPGSLSQSPVDTGAISSYFATYSRDGKTVVYYVDSADHRVTEDEVKKVAVINGILTASDFVLADFTSESAGLFTKQATITAVTDDVAPTTGTVAPGGSTNDTSLVVSGMLSSALVAGEVLKVYDGSTLLATLAYNDARISGTTWSYADGRTLTDGETVSYIVRTERPEYDGSTTVIASYPYQVKVQTAAGGPTVPTVTDVVADSTGYAAGHYHISQSLFQDAVAVADIAGSSPADGNYVAVKIGLSGTGALTGDLLTLEWGSQEISYHLTGYDVSQSQAAVLVPSSVLNAQGGGEFNVTAKITDAAGNQSGTASFQVDIPTEDADNLAITAPGSLVINLLGGDDVFSVTSTSWALVDGGSGNDTYRFNGTAGQMHVTDTGTNTLAFDNLAALGADNYRLVQIDAEDVTGYRTLTISSGDEKEALFVISGDGDAQLKLTLEGAQNWSTIMDWVDGSGSATGLDVGGAWSGYLLFIANDTDGEQAQSQGAALWYVSTADRYVTSGANGDVVTLIGTFTSTSFDFASTPVRDEKSPMISSVTELAMSNTVTGTVAAVSVSDTDFGGVDTIAGTPLIYIAESIGSGTAEAKLYTGTALTTVYDVIIIDNIGDDYDNTDGIAAGKATDAGDVATAINRVVDPVQYERQSVFVLVAGQNTTDGDDAVLWFWEDGSSGTAQKSELTQVARFTGTGAAALDPAKVKFFWVQGGSGNDSAPSFTSSGSYSIDENAATSTVAYDANATDADGDTITYSLSGTDAAKFDIVSTTGVVTLKSSADYENRQSYSFTVVASDGVYQTTKSVIVSVNNLNDCAPAFSPGSTGSVQENAPVSTVVYTAAATDADGDAITYSLSGTDAALLSISSSGAVTLNASANYESKTSYSFNVVASDTGSSLTGSTHSTTKAVTVSVVNLNDVAPAFSSGTLSAISSGITVQEGTAVTVSVFTAAATDPDGLGTISYSLSGTDAAKFTIGTSTGVVNLVSVADYETQTSYSFNVVASDGVQQTTQAVVVTVGNVSDSAPVITTSATPAVYENSTVVAALTNTDADGADNLATFTITGGTNSSLFEISGGNLQFKASKNYEVDAHSYQVIVTATDAQGNASSKTITVTLADVDEYYAAFAGTPDSNAAANSVAENSAVGTTVGITASASDADGTLNKITYSLVGDANGNAYSAGEFTINSLTGVVTVAGTVDYEAGATRTIYVKALSEDTSSVIQSYTVNVTNLNDNVPVITTDAAQSVAENSTVVAALTNTDADSAANLATFSITGGADADLFKIESGTLKFKAAKDYESDAHSYQVKVTASDGVNAASKTITVTLTDVNENAPVLTIGSAIAGNHAVTVPTDSYADANTIVGASDTSTGLRASSTDADASDTVTYSLVSNILGDPYTAGEFAIDSVTGVVTVDTIDGTNAATTRTIHVLASSSDGTSAVKAFTIVVANGGTASEGASATYAATVELSETAATGTAIVTAHANDADTGDLLTFSLVDAPALSGNPLFAIGSGTGAITLTEAGHAAIDYDSATKGYALTVKVSDGSNERTSKVLVHLANENDISPEFPSALGSGSVDENTDVSVPIYIAAATDADGDTITYSLSGTDADYLDIVSTTGVVTLIPSADYETKTSYSFNVIASDGVHQATQAVTVDVNDVNDNAPVLSIDSATVQLSENAAAGTIANADADATDADAGSTLTYTLVNPPDDGSSNPLFSIDANGQISLTEKGAATIDYESATKSYELTVKVSDGYVPHDKTATITVNLVNVNDNSPVFFSSTMASIAENLPASTVAYTPSATDADGDTITYTIGGTDVGYLNFANGVVTLKSPADFESVKTSYSFTVSAADGVHTTTQTVTLSVANAYDASLNGDYAEMRAATVAYPLGYYAIGGTTVAGSDARFTITGTESNDTVTSGNDIITGEANADTLVGLGGNDTITGAAGDDSITGGNGDDSIVAGSGKDYVDGGAGSDYIDGGIDTVGQTGIYEVAGLGSVYIDTSTESGAQWILVGYGANGNLPGLLSQTAGTYNADRQGSATLDIRQFITDSTKMAISWTQHDSFDVTLPTDSDASGNTITITAGTANGATVGVTAAAADADITNNLVSYYLVRGLDGGVYHAGEFEINADTGVVSVTDAGQIRSNLGLTRTIYVKATSSDGSYAIQGFTVGLNGSAPAAYAGSTTNVQGNSSHGVVVGSDLQTDNYITASSVSNNASVGLTVQASDADTATTVSYALVGDLNGSDYIAGEFSISASTGVVTVADAAQIRANLATTRTVYVKAVSADGSYAINWFKVGLDGSVPAAYNAVTVLQPNLLPSSLIADYDNAVKFTLPSGLIWTFDGSSSDSGYTQVVVTSLEGSMFSATGSTFNMYLTKGTFGANYDGSYGLVSSNTDSASDVAGIKVIYLDIPTASSDLSASPEAYVTTNGTAAGYVPSTMAVWITAPAGMLLIDHDTLLGGDGDDTIVGDQSDDSIVGGNGTDLLRIGASFNDSSNDQIVGIEQVALTASGLTLSLDSQTEGFTITGSTGADTIIGGSGNDTITGGSGIDSLTCGSGDDVFVFATAAELAADATVAGGIGSDTVRLATGTNALVLADSDFAKVAQAEVLDLTGTGTQAVTLGSNTNSAFSSGMTVTVAAAATSLNLQGGSSTVAITVTGTGNADTLIGGAGADTITGGAGADVIGLGSDGSTDYIVYGSSDGAAAGAATGYDEVSGFSSDKIQLSGFTNLGASGTIQYQTATLSADQATAITTDLLVVTDSSVAAGANLISDIAAALNSAYNLVGLTAADGSQAHTHLFSVKGAGTDYWVGLFANTVHDDATANGEFTVLAHVDVSSSGSLDFDNFWLAAVSTPSKPTSLSLTSDPGNPGDLVTTNKEITVGGLAAGSHLSWSEDSGATWHTEATDDSTFLLGSTNATYNAGTVQVRQVDANANYSAVLSSLSDIVIDTTNPSISLTDQAATQPGNVTFQWSLTEPHQYYSRLTVDGLNYDVTGSSSTLNLAAGAHTWSLYHQDAAGNMATVTGNNFTLSGSELASGNNLGSITASDVYISSLTFGGTETVSSISASGGIHINASLTGGSGVCPTISNGTTIATKITSVYDVIIFDDLIAGGQNAASAEDVVLAINNTLDSTAYGAKDAFIFVDGNNTTDNDDGMLWFWDDGGAGTAQYAEMTLIARFVGVSGPTANYITLF